MARGFWGKQRKKTPKLWKEREMAESWGPRLSNLPLNQLAADGLLGDNVSTKPPNSRVPVKHLIFRQRPLAMSFADLVILPISQIGSSSPTKRALWTVCPLNTELQGLPKCVFESHVFRHLLLHQIPADYLGLDPPLGTGITGSMRREAQESRWNA